MANYHAKSLQGDDEARQQDRDVYLMKRKCAEDDMDFSHFV